MNRKDLIVLPVLLLFFITAVAVVALPSETPYIEVPSVEGAPSSGNTTPQSGEGLFQALADGVTGQSSTDNDADNDGINDSRERHYGTNPERTDTNGDGLNDTVVVSLGLSPNRSFQNATAAGLQAAYSTYGSHTNFLLTHPRSPNVISSFEARQLAVWRAVGERYQEAIITNDTNGRLSEHVFYRRDWDQDGILNANDSDPDAPKDTDGDGILYRYYNYNMDTDFDPSVDKVGEVGDASGAGALANASPGRRDYFIWYDWMVDPYSSVDTSLKLTAKTRALISAAFGAHDIRVHWIEGAPIRQERVLGDDEKSTRYYNQRVPQTYKGIVNYVVSVYDMDAPVGGLGLDLRGGGEGAIFVGYGDARADASVIMHEFGHVVGPAGVFGHQKSGKTAMNTRRNYVDYEPNEWDRFIEHLGKVTYYRSLAAAVAPASFATYSRIEPANLHGPPIDEDRTHQIYYNVGGEPLAIGGWTVTEEDGHTYVFPEDAVIPPKGYVVLYTGNGTDTEGSYYWNATAPIFSDDACSGEITIRNESYITVASYTWTDANFGQGCTGD